MSIVVIGKDTRFLYSGAEAEARFNVSLTRAKASIVVVAPPSSTGPLGMLQTASARSTDDSARMLLGLGSGFEDLDEATWHGAHHIGSAACWQELPLALSMCRGDVSDRSMYVLRLAGLSPRTGHDLSVFCYQEVGGDAVRQIRAG